VEEKMKKSLINTVAMLLGASALGSVAQAADNSVAAKFAADRLTFFGKGDAAAILNQYADNATVVSPMGVLHGKGEIKGMIDSIIGEFAQPGVKFNLISQKTEGPIVQFVWSAETAKNIYDLGT
jgi:ketosteroid isomerase-like protein